MAISLTYSASETYSSSPIPPLCRMLWLGPKSIVGCEKITEDKASNASLTNLDLISYMWRSHFNSNASMWTLCFNSSVSRWVPCFNSNVSLWASCFKSDTSLWAPHFNSNASLWAPRFNENMSMGASRLKMKSASKSGPCFRHNCQSLLGQ